MSGVAIIGPGRMGLALGYALVQGGGVGEITVYGRHPEPPSHPLFMQGLARYVFGMEPLDPGTFVVFLAVPDPVVAELAHTLAAQGPAPDGCVAFHLSGSLPTDALAPLHMAGYEVGAFFLIQTIAHSVTGAAVIPGSSVSLTGSPEAIAAARRIGAQLDLEVLTVPAAWRPRVDAATTLASGFLVSTMELATSLIAGAGVDPDDAARAVASLMRGTLASIGSRGPFPGHEGIGSASGWNSATGGTGVGGAVARGDLEAVLLHLRALPDDARSTYAVIGRDLVRMGLVDLPEDLRRALIERFEQELGATR